MEHVTLKYINDETTFDIRWIDSIMPGCIHMQLDKEPDDLLNNWITNGGPATLVREGIGFTTTYEANYPEYQEEDKLITFKFGLN